MAKRFYHYFVEILNMTANHLHSETSRIFLWGFMGSGKTTLGKELANRLGFRFLDLDSLMEEREKMKVAEIFSQNGEQYFRKLEHETLKQTFTLSENIVVSTGGGTPCYFNNADLMNEAGISVYLRVTPKSIKKRLSEVQIDSRPMIKNLPWTKIMELYQKRQSCYESAQIIVSNNNHWAYALQFILKRIQNP